MLSATLAGTSLFLACSKGHIAVAEMLTKAGGEELFLKTDVSRRSCLYIACQEGHAEIKAGREVLLQKVEADGASCPVRVPRHPLLPHHLDC